MTTSRRRPAQAGPRELCRAPPGKPPFPVDARVVEDDTWLVLGADPRFREPAEHPIRVHTAAWDAEPARLGSVVVGAGRPLELRAIVHDLRRDPTWCEEWVSEALVEALREAERHRVKSLELPVLGALYGSMRVNPFLDLLRDALAAVEPKSLQRIWLLGREVPGDTRETWSTVVLSLRRGAGRIYDLIPPMRSTREGAGRAAPAPFFTGSDS